MIPPLRQHPSIRLASSRQPWISILFRAVTPAVMVMAGLALAPHLSAAAPVSFGGLTFTPFGQAEVNVTNLLPASSTPGAPAHNTVMITRLNVGSSNGVVIRMPGVSMFRADMTPVGVSTGGTFRVRLRGTNGLELGAVTFTGPSGTASPAIGFDPDFSSIGATGRIVELHCRRCATAPCPISVPDASGGGFTVAAISNVPVQIVGFSARLERGGGSTTVLLGVELRETSDMAYSRRGVREDHDEMTLSAVVPVDLPAVGSVELTALALGTSGILLPGLKAGNGLLAHGPSSQITGGLRLAWEGTGRLESSTNSTGSWSPVSTPQGTFETPFAGSRLFLQVHEQTSGSCRLDVVVSNAAPTVTLRAVRVVPGNAGTRIVAAVPTVGWTQPLSTPTNVTWLPIGGTVPVGAPLPGSLGVWFQQNPAPGKHVFLEYLDAMTNVVSRQRLTVPCD